MRVSIINLNLVGPDAAGQTILTQLQYFQERGDLVRILTLHPPNDVSDEVADLVDVVSLADLVTHRHDHFAQSDLFIYHYPSHYALIESIKSIARGVVIFYFRNVTPPDLWGAEAEREILQRGLDSVGRLAVYADMVVTDSPFNAEQLIEQHGCEQEQIQVLPMAISLEEFRPGQADAKMLTQYNLTGKKVILFVGRIAGNKRVDLLIEALPLVQKKVPDAALLLVGDNDSNPAFRELMKQHRQQIDKLDLGNAVCFSGRVEDLPLHYRLANVYASASLHEGFGVPLLEAMASGVPVVASNATAHPWVVGDAGLLATAGDAADLAAQILRVLSDDTLRETLIAKGLERVQAFSTEAYHRGWNAIIQEAEALLPKQEMPRARSLAGRRSHAPASVDDILYGDLEQLETAANVVKRGYIVKSGIPVIGPLVAWIRRNLTSHLREPYLDPMMQKQEEFNWQAVQTVRQVTEQLGHLQEETAREQNDSASVEERLNRIEQQLAKLAEKIEDSGPVS